MKEYCENVYVVREGHGQAKELIRAFHNCEIVSPRKKDKEKKKPARLELEPKNIGKDFVDFKCKNCDFEIQINRKFK